ncbi:MAG: RNA polymerase sigma factor [Flavobacteriaceae bacterium]|nr:RNA polymerase sigma factor [Flavobacteriaceae bacterium]
MKQNTLRIDNLLEMCKSGDRRAQMEIYDRYHRAMYNSAYRIVRNREMAEDVMQEGFIKAFEKLHTLKDPEMFGAWLKRIVINGSLTACRVSGSQLTVVTDKELPEASESDAAFEDAEGMPDQLKKMMQAMKNLHANYNLILTLHYLEGYSQEEVAVLMDMTHGNCRTMLSRAKESLRKCLQ